MASQFVVSLDFELYWGIRDLRTLESYFDNLNGVQQAIPQILDLFQLHKVEATWATVGFLFLSNFKEINNHLPNNLPTYIQEILNPYPYIMSSALNFEDRLLKVHFAPELILLIANTPGQEIGSHTYSHYYCLEKGQTIEQFKADIQQNIYIAKQAGITIETIILPRNQVNPYYESVLLELGIKAYRGTPSSFIYSPRKHASFDSIMLKGLRFFDTFFPIINHNTNISKSTSGMINIPASRFLQPFANRPLGLEKLKINRIKAEMTKAAKNGSIYHLWWHPHNFGINTTENLQQLHDILTHFNYLENSFGMKSINMKNLANAFLKS